MQIPICHPDDPQEHQDLHLDLLAADGGPVHHLLRLVGLLLRAEGDEGIPDQDKLVKKLSLLFYMFNLWLAPEAIKEQNENSWFTNLWEK